MHRRKEKKEIQELEKKRKQPTQGINIQQNLQKDFPPFPDHATKGYPHESPAKIQPPTISQKEPPSSITDAQKTFVIHRLKKSLSIMTKLSQLLPLTYPNTKKKKAILKIADEKLRI
ncbi:hypothetical protein NPIL_437611 [Nephila pilipes]|uniref:Uncharacterized protein n=1 Tax=Nephila pilipes TaxID=299642 RepID=A0A8X6U209_NEPPI|nr:hypothetical protein NPIL_437611 [Nephila pilipes]